MIYLASFVIGFSVLQLLIAIVNLVFRQSVKSGDAQYNGLVSVLIPARNEEDNIANLIRDLQNQDYTHTEIIVFNDQSTDRTAEIVEELARSDTRIRLVQSEGLPDGWLGKNYACHSLSAYAKGDYLLFLDADVRIKENSISGTVATCEKFKLGLLSAFPKQLMITWGEKITVPNMNFILLSLLPLILVRKSGFPSLAAANGQFMLFKASVYYKMGPHAKVKSQKAEDIEIARFYKKNQIKVACLAGINSIQCRMYTGFRDAVKGFSKNVIAFFGNSFPLAILYWVIGTLGFVAVIKAFPMHIFLLYIIILLLTRAILSFTSNQSIINNSVLLIPQQLALGVFIFMSVIHKFRKKYEWKGRNIS